MRIKKNIGVILILIGLIFTVIDPNNPTLAMEKTINFIKQYWTLGIILLGVYLIMISKIQKHALSINPLFRGVFLLK